jgi:exopolysaccharide biosynthesis polyprenyl glycosylphosphotransferase
VDEIIITIPFMHRHVKQVLLQARLNNLDLRIVPDLYGLSWRGASLEYVGSLPIVSFHGKPIPTLGRLLKRLIDIVSSLLALLVFAPVFVIIAAIIAMDSRGPILYRDLRVGKKGRKFACYKFRTMVPNAAGLKDDLLRLNERQGALFKLSNDPRITRVGSFLRKHSFDELPQLWNVLKGDMSLVGPRPPIYSEVQQYRLDQLRRLDVTPGLTGLWQVTARQDPSFERYLALDLEYIENWSLWVDLKILLQSIAVVLAGNGA